MPAIVAGANNLLGSARRVEAMKDVPTTADAPKRHLRWFQFRLRTVFVVMTLIAIAAGWVGWQAKIVQERKWLREHSHASFLPLKEYKPISLNETWPKGTPSVSWFRELLGDEAIYSVTVDRLSPANQYLNQLEAAFPEAHVRVYDFGNWQVR
jgi:hypothetical protein